ncbi:hypothetical protein HYW54_02535 [Candidatus Gottesmanbacteria bacterium]|nr:hypothetical protein [Candidatus Gottesmanbacteria bacterium]
MGNHAYNTDILRGDYPGEYSNTYSISVSGDADTVGCTNVHGDTDSDTYTAPYWQIADA